MPGSQHVEDMFHGKTMSTDDRLAAEYFRIANDAGDEFLVFHILKVRGENCWSKAEGERGKTLIPRRHRAMPGQKLP